LAGYKPWVLAALLLAIQFASDRPTVLGKVNWIGQAQWLLVAAGYWADRPLRARSATTAARSPR
jgi:hypothetical protein